MKMKMKKDHRESLFAPVVSLCVILKYAMEYSVLTTALFECLHHNDHAGRGRGVHTRGGCPGWIVFIQWISRSTSEHIAVMYRLLCVSASACTSDATVCVTTDSDEGQLGSAPLRNWLSASWFLSLFTLFFKRGKEGNKHSTARSNRWDVKSETLN